MRVFYLGLRRWFLSLFMSYGHDEPTHLTEVNVEWVMGQPWGDHHPDDLHQWWANSEFDSGPSLLYVYEPKLIEAANGPITIDWRLTIRRSKVGFKRGFFKFIVERVNTDDGTWDAIWLTGVDNWPPEVDLVEWYGSKAESNFHVSKPKHSVGAKRHKAAGVYSCWWEEDFIKLYYDGFLVRVYDKMEYYKEAMWVITSVGCTSKIQIPHVVRVIPKIYV